MLWLLHNLPVFNSFERLTLLLLDHLSVHLLASYQLTLEHDVVHDRVLCVNGLEFEMIFET